MGKSEGQLAKSAKDQLKSFVERIETLESDKKQVADDIRDVYSEAKSSGYDVRALRQIIRLRKQDAAERAELEALIDTYKLALGMISDLPLGVAAIERASTRFTAATAGAAA